MRGLRRLIARRAAGQFFVVRDRCWVSRVGAQKARRILQLAVFDLRDRTTSVIDTLRSHRHSALGYLSAVVFDRAMHRRMTHEPHRLARDRQNPEFGGYWDMVQAEIVACRASWRAFFAPVRSTRDKRQPALSRAWQYEVDIKWRASVSHIPRTAG
jgi:hypothetical protein